MSPQRDDVPALSHTHSRTILGFLVGFSVNNLCFLVFSSLCSRSMYYLSIAFSHSVQTHTHTPLWHDRLPRMTKTRYYLLLFIIADGAIISWPRRPSPSSLRSAYVFIYSDLSLLSLPFFPCPSPPLYMFMFIQTPLFRPPSLPPSAPVCPAFVTSLVSITTATFLSCLTIFNQEQRKDRDEMRQEGASWEGEG